jgi:hypothetical protein
MVRRDSPWQVPAVTAAELIESAAAYRSVGEEYEQRARREERATGALSSQRRTAAFCHEEAAMLEREAAALLSDPGSRPSSTPAAWAKPAQNASPGQG